MTGGRAVRKRKTTSSPVESSSKKRKKAPAPSDEEATVEQPVASRLAPPAEPSAPGFRAALAPVAPTTGGLEDTENAPPVEQPAPQEPPVRQEDTVQQEAQSAVTADAERPAQSDEPGRDDARPFTTARRRRPRVLRDSDEEADESAEPPPSALVRHVLQELRTVRKNQEELSKKLAEVEEQNATMIDLLQQRINNEDWYRQIQGILREEIKSQFANVKFFESWAPEADRHRRDAAAVGFETFLKMMIQNGHVDIPQRTLHVVTGPLQTMATDSIVRLRSSLSTGLRSAVFRYLFDEPDPSPPERDPERLPPIHRRYLRALAGERRDEWVNYCMDCLTAYSPQRNRPDSVVAGVQLYVNTALKHVFAEAGRRDDPTDSDVAFALYVLEAFFDGIDLQRPGGISHYGDYTSWLQRTRQARPLPALPPGEQAPAS